MFKITIGRATLYLGDCADLLPIIGPVDALVTDPPYEFETSGGGKFRKQRTLMERIDAADMTEGFNHTIFKSSLYGSVVTFCHNDQLFEIGSYLRGEYPRVVACGWNKTNPTPFANKNYKADVEPYIHAWRPGFHPQGKPSELSRIITTPVIRSPFDHPTVKPDLVMDKIIKNVAGATVIDPFMGTGSTGLAALRHGKDFIGIEKNPDFFNIACQRFYLLYGDGVEMPDSVSL